MLFLGDRDAALSTAALRLVVKRQFVDSSAILLKLNDAEYVFCDGKPKKDKRCLNTVHGT